MGMRGKVGEWHRERIPRGQLKGWMNLVYRLLDHGGDDVVPPYGGEEDLKEIWSLGEFWHDPVEFIQCRQSRCHQNVAQMWDGARADGYDFVIITGYALSDDGLWRQHTWGWYEGQIIETTDHRIAYYGFALNDSESARFYMDNGL